MSLIIHTTYRQKKSQLFFAELVAKRIELLQKTLESMNRLYGLPDLSLTWLKWFPFLSVTALLWYESGLWGNPWQYYYKEKQDITNISNVLEHLPKRKQNHANAFCKMSCWISFDFLLSLKIFLLLSFHCQQNFFRDEQFPLKAFLVTKELPLSD